MIRLSRGDAPVELDDTHVAKLTAKFMQTGDPVWNSEYIRSGLLAASKNKCAYCETFLTEESKYLEVDHFRCKQDFPDLVVLWSNLVPACKRCNVRKSSYNVDTDGMLINPFDDEPRNHVYLHNYRLKWRDGIGRDTIDTLSLNQSDRLVSIRMMVGEIVMSSLDLIRQNLEAYELGPQTTRRRNSIVRGIEALLYQATPNAEYSATTATILLHDPDYLWIRTRLVDIGLWNTLNDIENEARKCDLSI